jgi:glycosyltransferase involved in cell wall biosynthesis
MTQPSSAIPTRVGYVVKRYPRFSETFIVNELLAHEAVGSKVEIFSIRPCTDTHFQNTISQVRASVTRLSPASVKWSALWPLLQSASAKFPRLWEVLASEQRESALTVAQGLELAGHVRERGITHLHSHFASLQAGVTRLAALIAEIPYSVTAHAKDIFHDTVEEEVLAQRLQDAAAVVTVSRFNVEHLSDRFPHIADRIHCVYNGLTLADLPFAMPEQRSPSIVSVGRLVEKKGMDILIEACAMLRDNQQAFRCEIIGSGDLESSLRRQVQERGLESLVTLTGPLPQAEVKHRIQQAAVFAAPCVIGKDGDRDGLPTVLLESMALGTPCVSTDVTGIPEVIRHDQTGLVVPQEDPVALAAALTTVLTNRKLRVRYAVAARELIEEKFDSARTSQKLREVFAPSLCGVTVFQGAP